MNHISKSRMTSVDALNLQPPLPVFDQSGQILGFAVAANMDGLKLVRGGDEVLQGEIAPASPKNQGSLAIGPGLLETVVHFAFGVHRFAISVEIIPTEDSAFYLMLNESGKTDFRDFINLVRKSQHIDICLTQDVESSERSTGFENVFLMPSALPEIDWGELNTGRRFLGYQAKLPLLITGMTGGLKNGAEINFRLAAAAAEFGVPMGVGSQRIALENPVYSDIFAIKKKVPNVFLIANIGISQLGADRALDDCRRAIDMIEADALAIHLNIMQELVQVEGDRNFKGLRRKIMELVPKLDVPVLVKECGCGVDMDTARFLAEAGVRAIDVGGRGGTSWPYIEGLRAESEQTRLMGNIFRNWGLSTAQSLFALRASLPRDFELVATGGIRDGLMAAKALSLGATMVGIGLPLFRAAAVSELAVKGVLAEFERALKITMMGCGAPEIKALEQKTTMNPAVRETWQRGIF